MFVLFILILEYFDTIPYIGLRKKSWPDFMPKTACPQSLQIILAGDMMVYREKYVRWEFGRLSRYIAKSTREEKPTPFIGDKGETQKESVVVMVWNNADLASAMTCYVGRKPRNTTRLSLHQRRGNKLEAKPISRLYRVRCDRARDQRATIHLFKCFINIFTLCSSAKLYWHGIYVLASNV